MSRAGENQVSMVDNLADDLTDDLEARLQQASDVLSYLNQMRGSLVVKQQSQLREEVKNELKALIQLCVALELCQPRLAWYPRNVLLKALHWYRSSASRQLLIERETANILGVLEKFEGLLKKQFDTVLDFSLELKILQSNALAQLYTDITAATQAIPSHITDTENSIISKKEKIRRLETMRHEADQTAALLRNFGRDASRTSKKHLVGALKIAGALCTSLALEIMVPPLAVVSFGLMAGEVWKGGSSLVFARRSLKTSTNLAETQREIESLDESCNSLKLDTTNLEGHLDDLQRLRVKAKDLSTRFSELSTSLHLAGIQGVDGKIAATSMLLEVKNLSAEIKMLQGEESRQKISSIVKRVSYSIGLCYSQTLKVNPNSNSDEDRDLRALSTVLDRRLGALEKSWGGNCQGRPAERDLVEIQGQSEQEPSCLLLGPYLDVSLSRELFIVHGLQAHTMFTLVFIGFSTLIYRLYIAVMIIMAGFAVPLIPPAIERLNHKTLATIQLLKILSLKFFLWITSTARARTQVYLDRLWKPSNPIIECLGICACILVALFYGIKALIVWSWHGGGPKFDAAYATTPERP